MGPPPPLVTITQKKMRKIERKTEIRSDSVVLTESYTRAIPECIDTFALHSSRRLEIVLQ